MGGAGRRAMVCTCIIMHEERGERGERGRQKPVHCQQEHIKE